MFLSRPTRRISRRPNGRPTKVVGLVVPGLTGCVASRPEVTQSAGGDAETDASSSLLHARLNELAVRLGTSEKIIQTVQGDVADLQINVGKITARVATTEKTLETGQANTGFALVNVASTGGSLGGYLLALVLMLVAWRLWTRNRRLSHGLSHLKTAVKQAAEAAKKDGNLAKGEVTRRIKQAVARHEANRFGIVRN